MKRKGLGNKLWLGAALTVLLVPVLFPRALDAISQHYPPGDYQPPDASSTLAALPDDLPAKLNDTEMAITHYRLPGGNFLSQYINTLRDNNSGLVPYIPRLFSLEEYTLTESGLIDIDGQSFTRAVVRRKYSNRNYVILYNYQLGRTQVGSYTKAKLYQLPAAFTGANQFRLSVWQARCEDESCLQASQVLAELAVGTHRAIK